MADVCLENVTKVFPGGVKAVSALKLHVRDREFLVLVGPSGCGKSTILRMIAGLEDPSQGIIRIGGTVVNHVAPKDRDIAMVFQNYALYPHMTVHKNMAFGLKLRKYPGEEIHARVHKAARILGIEDLLDRKPAALSGGQRQRVALGRAIVRQPKAFLFDEPLSNLDARLRVEMRAELSRLHQRLDTTMIYVTHDQVEAMTLGHRIVVLNHGIVQQVAEPLALYNSPDSLFVAGFIGTPPMNLLRGRVVVENGAAAFDEGSARLTLAASMTPRLAPFSGRMMVLGIRPENLKFMEDARRPAQARLRAKVNVVEPLGDEMVIHLNTGCHDLVSKIAPDAKVQVNDDVHLALDVERAHVFDPDTGRNVTLCLPAVAP